jgi:hypothetical protein
MNRPFTIFAMSTLLLLGGLGQAQDLFGTPNVFGKVTFFRGNPEASFYKLATVGMNNSPLAHTLPGVAGATHVTIDFQGARHTFALAESGWHKQNIVLLVPANSGVQFGQHGRTSLAELFDALATDHTLLTRLSGATFADR